MSIPMLALKEDAWEKERGCCPLRDRTQKEEEREFGGLWEAKASNNL